MILCRQLTKVYRSAQGEVRSLDALDLEVRRGEFVCVRGPSGCGKTTLLLTLGGMLRPTKGVARVGGRDLYAISPRERARFRAARIGFVFQMFHLVPYLSVVENVLLAAGHNGAIDRRARAEELLQELGLAARWHHSPGELSAGERQRTAIARALFHRPELLLADEPTGNLDPENAGEVFRHLKRYQESGGTVVVVTHGATAEQSANRVLEMRMGRIGSGR